MSGVQYSDWALSYITQCSLKQVRSLISLTYLIHPTIYLPSGNQRVSSLGGVSMVE